MADEKKRLYDIEDVDPRVDEAAAIKSMPIENEDDFRHVVSGLGALNTKHAANCIMNLVIDAHAERDFIVLPNSPALAHHVFDTLASMDEGVGLLKMTTLLKFDLQDHAPRVIEHLGHAAEKNIYDPYEMVLLISGAGKYAPSAAINVLKDMDDPMAYSALYDLTGQNPHEDRYVDGLHALVDLFSAAAARKIKSTKPKLVKERIDVKLESVLEPDAARDFFVGRMRVGPHNELQDVGRPGKDKIDRLKDVFKRMDEKPGLASPSGMRFVEYFDRLWEDSSQALRRAAEYQQLIQQDHN